MIIAVTNLKGGVGKSTIARNLAAYFTAQGVKTCIIDTDLEQRTTCDWQERRDDTAMRIPVFPMTTVQALPKDVETHSRDGYNMIIIDGVPQIDQVATRTILICDILLIPITPSIDDLKSFERFLIRYNDVKVHRENIPAFLVLNKYNGRNNEDKEVRSALKLFGEYGIEPLRSTLGDRVAHRRGSKYGLTAYEWEDERAKKEVVALCEELEDVIESQTPNRSKHGKTEKKSITDLIATKSQPRKPSVAEIDAITSKIHESGKEKSQPLPVTEKVKRISVNAPIQLYIKAKTKSTIQDQTLMAYILRLIEEDVKN